MPGDRGQGLELGQVVAGIDTSRCECFPIPAPPHSEQSQLCCRAMFLWYSPAHPDCQSFLSTCCPTCRPRLCVRLEESTHIPGPGRHRMLLSRVILSLLRRPQLHPTFFSGFIHSYSLVNQASQVFQLCCSFQRSNSLACWFFLLFFWTEKK